MILLTDEEIERAFISVGKPEALDKQGLYGATRTKTTYDSKAVAKAQLKKVGAWLDKYKHTEHGITLITIPHYDRQSLLDEVKDV